MQKEILRLLFKLQNELIEHKFPINPSAIPSWYIEASGDIFRELCKDYVDVGYIMQKIRRLMTFGRSFTLGDFCEIERFRMYYQNNPEEINAFRDNVEILINTVENCKNELSWRYEIMRESLEIIKIIVDWSLGQITTCDAMNKILYSAHKIQEQIEKYLPSQYS